MFALLIFLIFGGPAFVLACFAALVDGVDTPTLFDTLILDISFSYMVHLFEIARLQPRGFVYAFLADWNNQLSWTAKSVSSRMYSETVNPLRCATSSKSANFSWSNRNVRLTF
ncbi:hypothetical protein ACNPM2_03865 [Stenotrophomonas geniculata]|uniref:hypothetical protein n=1 Tax=Stenotrophomonas TaxID=40323 RepID=UPI001785962D|nr:hypothetical protein [Stenotrophomonas sp. AS012628]